MHLLLFFGVLLLLLSRGFVGKAMQLLVLIAIFCFMSKTNVITILLILCVTTVLAIIFKLFVYQPNAGSNNTLASENSLEQLLQEEEKNKRAWDEHYERCRETKNAEN